MLAGCASTRETPVPLIMHACYGGELVALLKLGDEVHMSTVGECRDGVGIIGRRREPEV